jgi:hypothetical protein
VASADEVLRARALGGLDETGLLCDVTASGIEALGWIESVRREYALVVLDHDLKDVPAAEIETMANVMLPAADFIRCGSGTLPDDARGVAVAKPALASEFARAVFEMRART